MLRLMAFDSTISALLFEAGAEPERGTGAERGFDMNVSPHHLHELLADGEAEARAAVLAGG